MIQPIIIASLACLAVYVAALSEKMALFRLRQFGDIWLPWFIRKPLYDCLTCMASIWGTTFLVIQIGWTWQLLVLVPAVAGMNQIMDLTLDLILKMHDE